MRWRCSGRKVANPSLTGKCFRTGLVPGRRSITNVSAGPFFLLHVANCESDWLTIVVIFYPFGEFVK